MAAVGGTPSLKEMNNIVRFGKCFFVTAIQGQVTQDQVLLLVQFEQVSIELFLYPNLEPRHLS
jgi:hypothetical protein